MTSSSTSKTGPWRTAITDNDLTFVVLHVETYEKVRNDNNNIRRYRTRRAAQAVADRLNKEA